MNFNSIMHYKQPEETYYTILGCHQSSTIEQINREYKLRALQLHPDKNLDNPESLEKFRRLQAAKDVLSDESSRRSYDCWLNSRICIPFEQWQNRKGHSMHWAGPRAGKLSIQTDQIKLGSAGQGSECKRESKYNNDWLEKFRNYEI